MPEIWTAVTGSIILILFWRQLLVFKLSRKINYAPIVLIFGSISSISLFAFLEGSGDLKMDIQHALMPLLISLMFYMVMHIMHQVNVVHSKAAKENHEKLLSRLITDISSYFTILDDKLSAIENTEEKTLEAVQLTLKNELSEFNQLSSQQSQLSTKLEEMYKQEESALMKIQRFLEHDILDLDTVVHRHIDILRIAEQDHFNKIHDILDSMNKDKDDSAVEEAVTNLSRSITIMQENYVKSVSSVAKEVSREVALSLESMSTELNHAKQLSESLNLSAKEYEVKLNELHKHSSELLQKSDTINESMEDAYQQSQKLRPVYSSLNELITRLMDIYAEYKHAKKELHVLASELGNAEERHFVMMDKKMDDLGIDIHQKIDASLHELKEHYHIADRDVTTTVKALAAKAQLQKSYSEE